MIWLFCQVGLMLFYDLKETDRVVAHRSEVAEDESRDGGCTQGESGKGSRVDRVGVELVALEAGGRAKSSVHGLGSGLLRVVGEDGEVAKGESGVRVGSLRGSRDDLSTGVKHVWFWTKTDTR